MSAEKIQKLNRFELSAEAKNELGVFLVAEDSVNTEFHLSRTLGTTGQFVFVGTGPKPPIGKH